MFLLASSVNRQLLSLLITDRKGKVMFSQVFVFPQSASWLLVHCSDLQRGR